MAEEQQNYEVNYASEVATKIRDLEERQKVAKDRMLLIGKNLIDFREKTQEDILEIKKTLEEMNNDFKKIKDFVKNLAYEAEGFARKNEVALLSKQAKMFQPLEMITKEEAREIIKEEIKKIKG